MNYIIVTPVRNEEKFVENTIRCVCHQSVKPSQWLILNDGSTDSTREIVGKYRSQHPWITLIDVADPKIYEVGARIAFLLNEGVRLSNVHYDFILKLDADVSFADDFCENILNAFAQQERLGIASGHMIYEGERESIRHLDHTRGATKFFRKSCWEDVDGVYLTTGWDTICDIEAQMKGWQTRTLDFYFTHNKTEGLKKGSVRQHYWNGIYCGRVPYHGLYFALRLASNAHRKPLILSTLAELCGYLNARFIKPEKPFPKDVTAYYRKKQVQMIKNFVRLH